MARALDLHLELPGSAPSIWRRVRMRGDLSLADLHRVIQIAMRWDDVRLHVFDVAGQEYGPEPGEEEIFLHWAGEDDTITIAKAVELSAGRFEYTYDFAAEQRIVITATASPAGEPARLRCIDGGGAGFDLTGINRRLLEEFQITPASDEGILPPEEQFVADLTLLLLFLTSFEEGKGTRVANKTLRLDTLDSLSESGLVVTNKHRKGVQLTDRGLRRAESLLQKVTPLLRS
jgi:hypothetical protein